LAAASGIALALALAGCNEQLPGGSNRHLSPIPPATLSLMAAQGMSKADPILVRAYKKESELEVWKRGSDGKYALLKTYPICRWSGQLGPKTREGDRQAPEGFYNVTPAQMNPNSAYYLSFDTGYPNAYDRAHGYSGANLMVHGTCSSRGCFAMTDAAIAEVYAVAREAFSGGQRSFQFQSYPFRMTADNLAKLRSDPHMPFWKNLKEGSDYFEVVREEPRVGVCGGKYVFGGSEVGSGSCSPHVDPAVAEKRQRDEQKVAELAASMPAVKIVYEDGGGNATFHKAMVASAGGSENAFFPVLDSSPRNLGSVSRPEALAMGPQELTVETGKAKADKKPSTALAFAAAEKAGVKPVKPGAIASGLPKATSDTIQVATAGDDGPVFVPPAKPGAIKIAPTPVKAAASAPKKPEDGAKAQGRMPADKSASKPAADSDRRAEVTGAVGAAAAH
jgi:murein L,D-transpeptidase YafK